MKIAHPRQYRTGHTTLALAVAIACLPLILAASELVLGDSRDRVRDVLGEPRGSIHAGSYELLQYDRGRVELRDGLVTSLELVSTEEATAQAAARAEATRLRQEQDAIAREQRRVDGTADRDRAITNPDFLASSGARQVEYWDAFRRRYPEVSIGSEYAAALAKRDNERAEAETARRLAQMEARVSEAEERARDAEEAAEDAERKSRRRYVYYAPPYVNVGYPVCPPGATNPLYQPTYPTTVRPYYGYSFGGYPTYIQPAATCVTPATQSSSLRVRMSF